MEIKECKRRNGREAPRTAEGDTHERETKKQRGE